MLLECLCTGKTGRNCFLLQRAARNRLLSAGDELGGVFAALLASTALLTKLLSCALFLKVYLQNNIFGICKSYTRPGARQAAWAIRTATAAASHCIQLKYCNVVSSSPLTAAGSDCNSYFIIMSSSPSDHSLASDCRGCSMLLEHEGVHMQGVPSPVRCIENHEHAGDSISMRACGMNLLYRPGFY